MTDDRDDIVVDALVALFYDDARPGITRIRTDPEYVHQHWGLRKYLKAERRRRNKILTIGRIQGERSCWPTEHRTHPYRRSILPRQSCDECRQSCRPVVHYPLPHRRRITRALCRTCHRRLHVP